MEFYEWKYQTLYPRVEASLLELGYAVHQARNRAQAREILLDLLDKTQAVSVGSSITLRQIGLSEALEAGGYSYTQHEADPPSREALACCREALRADTFITGVDAITRDGQLVFVDVLGHRPAAVLFGPRRVCVVASMGKVVPDVEMALRRIHGEPTKPEVEEGIVAPPSPSPEERAGNSLTIVENCLKFPQRIHLVLVMEPLGSGGR
jgi:L-lactate utilization protein LutB